MRSYLSRAAIRPLREAGSPAMGVWLIGIGFLIPAIYLFWQGQLRPLLTFMFFIVFVVAWMRDKAFGLMVVFHIC